VIVRVSEAWTKPGSEREFLARLLDLVADFPTRHPGLLTHQVLVDLDDPRHVQYVTHWRDEDALIGYAGPRWREVPVTFPDEDLLLSAPLSLRHFTEPHRH
jgi:hypothetical protein